MINHLHILTLTHKGTALRDIGQVVSQVDESLGGRATYLKELCYRLSMDELLYTATCNRVLFFLSTRERVTNAFKAELLPNGCKHLADQLDHYQGFEAVNHLFEVAASVDSLVVGERQILGQLKKAYDNCKEWGLIGDDIRIIAQRMIVAAKSVYAETRIGEKSVSVVSLAMRAVMRKSPSPESRVLMIGAGQTNALVAKFLRKYKLDRVTVFNRSLERAQKLASTFSGGRAFTLDQLQTYGEGFDILIVCTGASDPIITSSLWPTLLAGEDAKDKQILDLAVPANVCAELVNSAHFNYIDVEQLREEAEKNLAFRSQEIERAREVIDRNVEQLETIYRQRLLERALKDIPVAVREIRSRAVNKVFHKELESLNPEARELIDRMLGYVEKKYISIPMRKAREEMTKQDQQSKMAS